MRWIGLFTIASLLTACTGDDSTGASPSSDAGSDGATLLDAGDAAGHVPNPCGCDAGNPDVAITSATVYAGSSATVSATVLSLPAWYPAPSGGFLWALVVTPPGSALTTASIVASSTGSMTLVPDVPGDYQLQVGQVFGTTFEALATTTIHALAAPVFFARTILGGGGGKLDLHVAGHDGSDSHSAACTTSIDSTQAEEARQRTIYTGAAGVDWWEAPAGQPSRFAFASAESLFATDAGYDISLLAGLSSDDCTTAPTTLLTLTGPLGALTQPRFSVDGSRVAFLEPLGASFQVSTVAIDGTTHRALAPIYAGGAPPDGGADESANIHPEWTPAGEVAFPRPNGDGTWSVIVVTDQAGAPPSTLCTATGTTPHHIAPLGGGILAAFSPATGAPTDLFLLDVAAPGGVCTLTRNLTNLAGASSRAHDFALSPDGTMVALLLYDATANDGGSDPLNEGVLSIVGVDGGAPIAIDTSFPGRIGPRWIANGSRLVFTRAATPAPDGGEAEYAEAVRVILPDGGAPYDLAIGDGANTIVAGVGPGGSCAIARAPAGRSPVGAIALALLFTRRRRSRSVACARTRIA